MALAIFLFAYIMSYIFYTYITSYICLYLPVCVVQQCHPIKRCGPEWEDEPL